MNEISRDEWVQLDQITVSPRLQMRDFGDADALSSQPWVEYLGEVLKDGDKLPPLEVVREVKGKQTRYWLYGGFHRYECHRKAGSNSVLCRVTDGTFEDAQFYALKQNSGQPLQRRDRDISKAIRTLIDSPALFARLQSRPESGTIRRIAATVGVSTGTVQRFLDLSGLRVARTGEIVKAVKEPEPQSTYDESTATSTESQTTESEDDGADIQPERITTTVPTPQPVQVPESRIEIVTKRDRVQDTLSELQRGLRAVAEASEYLLASSAGIHLRRIASNYGVPLAKVVIKDPTTETRRTETGHVTTAELSGQTVETWPALMALINVVNDTIAATIQPAE